MRCPECKTKLTSRHYDEIYEWWECPGCEGAFTVDEIQEVDDGSSKPKGGRKQGDRKRTQGAKADRGGRSQRENAGRKNGKVSEGDAEIRAGLVRTKSGVAAKGKKRRTEIAEDEEVIAKFEEEILIPKVKQIEPKHHRDEVESRQVVNIWGDELEDIYEELGISIDTPNAQDKALILWRELRIQHGVTARDAEVSHAVCKEHS